MAKIVIDARELRTSTGRYVERLLHHLQQLDSTHDFTVLLKPTDIDDWQPTNPKFSKATTTYEEFSFGEQLGYKNQLNGLKGDLVHFPMVQQPVLYRSKTVTTMNDLTTVRFRNLTKNKWVFAIKQRIYAWLNKRVARQTGHIITYSEFVKQDVVSFAGVNPDKISAIHLAAEPIIDPAVVMPALENSPFIMYVGRPMSHKNLERLIEAFKPLQTSRPDLRLVLAGRKDANYLRIESMVAARKIDNVIFTDFVSEGQLRWLYENCAAYIFPSLSEGFGLPGLEAMAHGAPVVSSNATCLPEIYGAAAHYFDPTDVQAMADAINEVLTDRQLRDRLVAAGKQQVAKYSWRRTAEQTLAVYNEVLDK
jgi:glycosyltransferase involved in cell wall biosynthesis